MTNFHTEKLRQLDDNEEGSVIDMLRQILRYELEERPSAEELLSQWFADDSVLGDAYTLGHLRAM